MMRGFAAAAAVGRPAAGVRPAAAARSTPSARRSPHRSTRPPAAATTVVAGGVGPSVATTAIPGAAGAATDARRRHARPATDDHDPARRRPHRPRRRPPTPDTGGDPGTDTAAPTSAPGPTSPPVTDITDGDPVTFCPAVDRALPLYYVMSIGGLDGEATAAAYEIAVAPALSGPLTDAANSAPSVVAPPFQRWAERTALAVAAFKSAGATDAQVASFGQAFAAQIEALTDAGGAQNPPDPIAGGDRRRHRPQPAHGGGQPVRGRPTAASRRSPPRSAKRSPSPRRPSRSSSSSTPAPPT